MEKVNACIVCGSANQRFLFAKNSSDGRPFNLMQCIGCGLRFISPRPDDQEIRRYYTKEYFTRRTDRGYNNYFSGPVKNEIERVIRLNLQDLDFYAFESSLVNEKRSLDIGCAAGYFVNFMKSRGWIAEGIDVSEECVDFAVRELKLSVTHGSYLEKNYTRKFNLITLWATIEHLHNPRLFIEKINNDLTDNGRLFLSTCRAGGINFMRLFGQKWRYYNFPEHLYFFSYGNLKKLLLKNNFEILRYMTYGSGLGRNGSLIKKSTEFAAKKFTMGDMMIIAAVKNKRN